MGKEGREGREGREGGHLPFGMIQSDDVVLHAVDPPEIPHQDRGDGTQEDAVRRHEVEEAARGRQDLPRHHDPRDQGADELAAADVDVAGAQRGQVVGGREAVGGDVDAQRGEGEGEAGEEAARSARPVGHQAGWVPVQRTVLGLSGGRAGDADEGDEGEDERQHGHVEPLPFDACFAISGEIGHVYA